MISRFRQNLIAMGSLAVAMAAIAWYLGSNWTQVKPLLSLEPGYLLAILLLLLVQMGLQAFANRMMFRSLGYAVGFDICVWLSVVGNAANQFLPLQSGSALRAFYLKRVFAVELSQFGSAVIALQLMILINSCMIASAIGLVFMPWNWATLLVLVSSGSVFLVAALIFFLPRISNPQTRIMAFAARAIDGLHNLKSPRSRFYALLLCANLLCLVDSSIFYLACRCVGLDVHLANAVFLSSFVSVAAFISLTPGNIGIRESLYGIFSQAVVLTPVEAVSVSVLSRLLGLVRTFSLLPMAIFFLNRRAKSSNPETEAD